MPKGSYRNGYVQGTDWRTIELECAGKTDNETTRAAFVPEKGVNLVSLNVGGIEYMRDLGRQGVRTMFLGSPVLYPSPNRVANATYTFDSHVFQFEPNHGTMLIHGLVGRIPWEVDEPVVGDGQVSACTRIRFAPGTELVDVVPIRNTLEIKFTLTPGKIRYDFTVSNEDETKRLPFGLAIHPYFQIYDEREDVRIQVPATKWMDHVDLMPTGNMVGMGAVKPDISKPTPLSELDLDDVFYGLKESKPQTIFYDKLGKKVTLTASDMFTHSVVFTPVGMPFLCIENQSCSTDAHNLYAQGLVDESHLLILDPGQSMSSYVEIAVSDL